MIELDWNNNHSVMCLISDIGNEVYLERMNNINKYKNDMFLSVSHNLKTPINSIKLITESLLLASSSSQNKIPEDWIINLTVVKNNIVFLETMVRDILDYTSFEEKTFSLEISRFKLS